MISCDSCKGENVQKLSLVYEGGFSNLKATSSGVGVGFGGDGAGIGIGSSTTKGTSQSILSQKASPPARKKPVKVGLLYGAATTFVYYFAPGNLGIAFILLLAGGIHVFANLRYNRMIYPKLFKNWDLSYLCMKCGAISVMKEQGVSHSH